MAHIYVESSSNAEYLEKLNIDQLYEKKQKHDMRVLELFKMVLARVHKKIKNTSKLDINAKLCWYVVPEYMIGVSYYDQGSCIAYLMCTLKKNGFKVDYFHPNLMMISWAHWVPEYVRNEVKKQTGIKINEYGDVVEDPSLESETTVGGKGKPGLQQIPNSKKYTPIASYKPTGIYNANMIEKIKQTLN